MNSVSLNSCKFCGIEDSTEVSLKVCSGCELAWYCSREHQEFDWKRHKPLCRTSQRASQTRLDEQASTSDAHRPTTPARAPAITDASLPISSDPVGPLPYPTGIRPPPTSSGPGVPDPSLLSMLADQLAAHPSPSSNPLIHYNSILSNPQQRPELTVEQLLLLQSIQRQIPFPDFRNTIAAQSIPMEIPSGLPYPTYQRPTVPPLGYSNPLLALIPSYHESALRPGVSSHTVLQNLSQQQQAAGKVTGPPDLELVRRHSMLGCAPSIIGPEIKEPLRKEPELSKPSPVKPPTLFYVPHEQVDPTPTKKDTESRIPDPDIPGPSRPPTQVHPPKTMSHPSMSPPIRKPMNPSATAPQKLCREPRKSGEERSKPGLPSEVHHEVPKLDHSQNLAYSVSLAQHLERMARLHPTMSRYDAFCLRIESIARESLQKLLKYGWAVVDGLLGDTHCSAILDDIKKLYAVREFDGGKLMKTRQDRRSDEIRSDKIYWFDNRADKNSEFVNLTFLLGILDSIVGNFSENLISTRINGRSRAMVACYPGSGARYVRHVDNPVQDGRLLTCIYYTNRKWKKEHGGVLKLFPVNAEKEVEVEPIFDRFLVFWSDKRNPHEVLPSFHDRFAVTVWYFDELEKARAQLRPDIEKPSYRNLSSYDLGREMRSSDPSHTDPGDLARRRTHGEISTSLSDRNHDPLSMEREAELKKLKLASPERRPSISRVNPSSSKPGTKPSRRNRFMMGSESESSTDDKSGRISAASSIPSLTDGPESLIQTSSQN